MKNIQPETNFDFYKKLILCDIKGKIQLSLARKKHLDLALKNISDYCNKISSDIEHSYLVSKTLISLTIDMNYNNCNPILKHSILEVSLSYNWITALENYCQKLSDFRLCNKENSEFKFINRKENSNFLINLIIHSSLNLIKIACITGINIDQIIKFAEKYELNENTKLEIREIRCAQNLIDCSANAIIHKPLIDPDFTHEKSYSSDIDIMN